MGVRDLPLAAGDFDVSGCGHDTTYNCGWVKIADGLGPDSSSSSHVECHATADPAMPSTLTGGPVSSEPTPAAVTSESPANTPPLLAAIEDWANTVCACHDASCAAASMSKLTNLTGVSAETPQPVDQWLPRYMQAILKGKMCVQALQSAAH